MADYKGLTFEQLAKHADEGWNLAATRTAQLREAMKVIMRTSKVLELRKRQNQDPNDTALQEALDLGRRMFLDLEKTDGE